MNGSVIQDSHLSSREAMGNDGGVSKPQQRQRNIIVNCSTDVTCDDGKSSGREAQLLMDLT